MKKPPFTNSSPGKKQNNTKHVNRILGISPANQVGLHGIFLHSPRLPASVYGLLWVCAVSRGSRRSQSGQGSKSQSRPGRATSGLDLMWTILTFLIHDGMMGDFSRMRMETPWEWHGFLVKNFDQEVVNGDILPTMASVKWVVVTIGYLNRVKTCWKYVCWCRFLGVCCLELGWCDYLRLSTTGRELIVGFNGRVRACTNATNLGGTLKIALCKKTHKTIAPIRET